MPIFRKIDKKNELKGILGIVKMGYFIAFKFNNRSIFTYVIHCITNTRTVVCIEKR